MKYCYKNFCITGGSILCGILLSIIFMLVYSNDRLIIINSKEDQN